MPGEAQVAVHYLPKGGSHGGGHGLDLPYTLSPSVGAALSHSLVQQERFKGIRYRPELDRYISEIRPAQPRKRKIWLGTYKTAEEAARAFDAGIYYTKKPITYNFQDSPDILEPLPENLTAEQEHIEIQKKAKAAAARVQAPSQGDHTPNAGKYPKYAHSYTSQRAPFRLFDQENELHFARHPPREIQFSEVLNR